MKKNMTKCVIGLLFICVLFVACDFGKGEKKESEGELVVYNQTSCEIGHVRYCGEELLHWYTSNGILWSGVYVDQGKKASAKFSDEETGYVFFEIRNGYSIPEVRTNEIITVKKGEKITLSITDNTLVVVSGKSKPVTVLQVINRDY